MTIEDTLAYKYHDLPKAYWAMQEGNGTLADCQTLKDYDIDPLCPHAPDTIAEIVSEDLADDRADYQRRLEREGEVA
ncbi:MAG: hypothetical protein AAGF20_00235 [Pseudomonadota bacterium]